MALVLSPVTAFNNLLNIDRKIALPLVAGLAVLSAAAIATTWGVDLPTMGLMGLYLAALGVLLIIIANAIQDPKMGKALGWFLTILIMAIVTCFFVSAVFRQQGVINPTYCLVRFWEPCSEAEAGVVRRNEEAIQTSLVRERGPGPVLPPPPRIETPGNVQNAIAFDIHAYQVFIQFAGLLTRDTITQLNSGLRARQWNMQRTSGERTATAQGLNEVRYAPGHEPAAEALARNINEARITSSPVVAKEVQGIRPGTLEVWISN